MSATDTLCADCGAEAAQGRAGQWFHTEGIPPGNEAHSVEAIVERSEWDTDRKGRADIAVLASELVLHHTATHPMSDCPFSTRLVEALRTR